MKITGEDVVEALRWIGRTVPVGEIAFKIGTTDTRAIATAARKPANDGRIKVTFRKGAARYRFVRVTPRPQK